MKNTCKHYSPNPIVERLLQPDGFFRKTLLGALVVVGAASSPGCSTFGVKPWDHDLLAEQAMQVDAYPLQSSIDDHIYFSKEASSGGRSFAGGGCGCN